jgi:hypothetical protein
MGSAMSVHDEDEAPLDPAQERLRRKLVRLLFVSGGIMMAGLIAVFAAIVYKVRDGSETAQPAGGGLSAQAPATGDIPIPPGHRLTATALDGDRALLSLVSPDGGTVLLLVDLATGAELARRRLAEE